MPVKFLSEEWTKELKEGLNASEAFRKGVGSTAAKLQQIITGPDGDQRDWIKIDGAPSTWARATSTRPMPPSRGLRDGRRARRSEINAVSAFMSGKLKIGGNMMLIMSLQGAFSELPKVMQEMDVDYT